VGERTGEVIRAGLDESEPVDVTAETATLRSDIEQTRAGMGETIDAIQGRLDPEALTEQAKDSAQEVADRTIAQAKEAVREATDHAIAQAKEAVRDVTGQAGAALRGATIGKVEDMTRSAGETAGGWRQTFVATVKAHPIPATIAGLTLGYLFLNRESGSSRGGVIDGRPRGYLPAGGGTYGATYGGSYGASRPGEYGVRRDEPSASDRAGDLAGQAKETAGQLAGQAQDRVGQMADQVQETAGQVSSQVQETAGQMADQVQEQAHRAQGFLSRQLDENPLAVGAVAVVLGGALGAAIGTTPREDRFFGEARDRLMGRAQEATQETLEKVGRVADEVKGTVERATEEVKSTAQQEARAQNLVPEGAAAGGPPSAPRANGTGGPA
jgi:hypothetical protein